MPTVIFQKPYPPPGALRTPGVMDAAELTITVNSLGIGFRDPGDEQDKTGACLRGVLEQA